ncbi:MAG: malto-oligosyltrehalose synthase [Chlamydiales bacterium]|nr:malto-oligosyltrehalose synthase [Chlamydiales bacterium]
MNSLYRFQINAQFTFDEAKKALSYLHELGFDGVYCSPFYAAGSDHGYDITDPNRLNPHVGNFEAFCAELKKLGMQLVVDVVPNHMGFAKGQNKWWQDVLKHGPKSRYAHFFDIDWEPEKKELHGKVLLPILGKPYGEALDDIKFKNGQLFYFDFPLPLAPGSEPLREKGIHALLEAQHYRLAYWRCATSELNYRRFFNIAELVAICIEHEDVFEAHHKWLFELIEKEVVQGLRIDHPDGLLYPEEYLKRLRKKHHLYTVVEKILQKEEELQPWPIEGSVGYEYLNLLNALFVKQESEKALTKLYESFFERELDEILYTSKFEFAHDYMASEVNALAAKLDHLSEEDPQTRDFTRQELTQALTEVISAFPIYRTYFPKGDKKVIHFAIEKAKKEAFHLGEEIFDFIERVLLSDPFVLKFQQLTAPMMAKGLEDTTFYVYNRFLSLNEVGGDPAQFGISIDHFHKKMEEKREKWPLGMIATSTHDAKRSEDARMRLNILAQMPDEWEKMVKKWHALNGEIDGNTAYHIYQTLIAGWPKGRLLRADFPALFDRMWSVVLKSIREAKQYTDWNFPDIEYEEVVRTFLKKLLTPNSRFLTLFLPFMRTIEPLAEKSSLAQLAIKVALPGVLDTYQGNESWNYRLVDPDNRHPFSYGEDDSKQRFLKLLMRFRKEHKELFLEGEYVPLDAGPNTVAFIRRTKREEIVVVAGRFFTQKLGVPKLTRTYHNVMTGEEANLKQLLKEHPAVYLYAKS